MDFILSRHMSTGYTPETGMPFTRSVTIITNEEIVKRWKPPHPDMSTLAEEIVKEIEHFEGVQWPVPDVFGSYRVRYGSGDAKDSPLVQIEHFANMLKVRALAELGHELRKLQRS